ncbi:hypothetical protein [Caenispirillum bisanense]|uniref:hypothetical protein n=1 Tax=Caenispirillum bisanense TaxID=414052 RepID=UPI001FEBD426|nr:hypothetical protein [Caenispirillum bisanense]
MKPAVVRRRVFRFRTPALGSAHLWCDGFESLGKLRYVGVSNFSGWQVMKSLAAADHRDRTR